MRKSVKVTSSGNGDIPVHHTSDKGSLSISENALVGIVSG